jgi:uncharacterized protein YukE
MTPERTEQLDADISSVRSRIAEVQDRLGELHRGYTGHPGAGWAARQQSLLVEMSELSQRLNDLDNRRRGFGPERRT